MAARVLGTGETVTGVYKITNKLSGMSYIGQAKDIRERWREHLKCGLGIDTPSNNRLYQAMLKDGVDNFTFELLEHYIRPKNMVIIAPLEIKSNIDFYK